VPFPKRPTGSVILPAALADRVRDAVDRLGERRAAERAHVATGTIARAAGRLAIREASALAIAQAFGGDVA
jgi:hypothetical protein